jgi:DNA-binding CsgD family transcriptional regulator
VGVGATGPVETPLVEREDEIAALTSLTTAAAGGRGGLAWIEGPAGIGKSRLLAAAREQADVTGFVVATAQASDLEAGFAFGVVRRLFEPLLAERGRNAPVLSGAAASAAPVFGPTEPTAAAPSFAVLHGLFWLTVDLSADAPLLLVVDDVHWCDLSSLRFLGYLGRRLDQLSVGLQVAARPEDGPDPALLAAVHDSATLVLRPALLSTAGVRELLGSGVDDDLVAACAEATGGNPLRVRELARRLADEEEGSAAAVQRLGRATAAEAVLERLRRQPPAALAVARAAAILGDGVSVPAIAALAGLSEEEAARATGSLAAAEILGREMPVAFVHPLVREAVYGDIPPRQRELQHERAARILHEGSAPAEQVASHLLVGPVGPQSWVRSTLEDAGRAAFRRGAVESAADYLRRAVDHLAAPQEAGELLAALGTAEALVRGAAAVDHLRAALEATSDPVRRAELVVDLGRILLHAAKGTGQEVVALSEQAAAALDGGHPDLRAQLEANILTAGHFEPAVVPDLAERMRRHVDAAEGNGLGAALLAAAAAHHCLMRNEPAERCAELARRAARNRSLLDTDAGTDAAVSAMVGLALADVDDAVGFCAVVLDAAHRRGSIFLASAAYIFNGFTRLLRGDLDEAESSLRTAFDNLELWGMAHAPSPAAFLADVLLERGDLDGAAAALERAGLPPHPPEGVQLNWWLASRLRLTLERGRIGDALDQADDCARRFAAAPPAWMPWRALKAEVLTRAGRRAEATELAVDEVELARKYGAPRTLGRALRVLGTAQGEDGIEKLTEAVAVLERSTARLERARALLVLGDVLHDQGDRDRAREPLAQALDLASVCGADALAGRARAQLLATGARPRTTALSGVRSLTPSERRVAELAAAGRSNKDIAQELYVVPRTVEIHLTHAYRKLGIRSRRDLPRALVQTP